MTASGQSVAPHLAVQQLKINNLLSFGGESHHLTLKSLNLLIGPNGSGKSNLMEVIGLLQSLPKDLAEPIREGGGIQEWLWKGAGPRGKGLIEAVLPRRGASSLRYKIALGRAGYRLEVADERIENEVPIGGRAKPFFYFGYENGRPMLSVAGGHRSLRPEEINPQQSVLSQRKDPDQYPEVTYVGQLFQSFRLYRDWEFGINSRARETCPADSPADFLQEDASNLGIMLNRLLADPRASGELIDQLKTFYREAKDIHATIVEGGRVEIRLEQRNGFTIPALRLSDGTLRWISLLAILLHPEPPALVCIEEPELGLHPDMIPPLAKLLCGASERMQLIVTTHSDGLVEEFTDRPEDVVVCESVDGSTSMKRLSPDELAPWLAKYKLGELWRTGEIGGNRW